MGEYKLTQHYFDGNVLRKRGTIMSFDGSAPSTAEPLDTEAKREAAKREAEQRANGRHEPMALSEVKSGSPRALTTAQLEAELKRRKQAEAAKAELEDETEDEAPKPTRRRRKASAE